jgi:glucose-6-phosphate 1-dehydrogenase
MQQPDARQTAPFKPVDHYTQQLQRALSDLGINFKTVPQNNFPEKAPLDRNKLVIRLQPDEHIELEQMAKIPGPGGYRFRSFSLDMDYKSSIGKQFPDAYERLIMDVIRGNQTLFMREDEVRASWEWIHSIIDNWEGQELKLYQAGTQALSDEVLMPGHEWNKI